MLKNLLYCTLKCFNLTVSYISHTNVIDNVNKSTPQIMVFMYRMHVLIIKTQLYSFTSGYGRVTIGDLLLVFQ